MKEFEAELVSGTVVLSVAKELMRKSWRAVHGFVRWGRRVEWRKFGW